MDLDEWSHGDDKEAYFNNLASQLGFKNCACPGASHDNCLDRPPSIIDTNRLQKV